MSTTGRDEDPQEYWLDAWQRSVRFLEELQQRDIARLLSISEERRRAILDGLRHSVESSAGPGKRKQPGARVDISHSGRAKKEAPLA